MSTLNVNTLKNGAGTRERFTCSAWVSFAGTSVTTINGSGNVTSITDDGAGEYLINFETALANTGYAVVGSVRDINDNDAFGGDFIFGRLSDEKTTSQFRAVTFSETQANATDYAEVCLIVIGGD